MVSNYYFNCFSCQARSKSEWCKLTNEEVDLLNRAKIGREYRANDFIYTQGEESEGIYCVESGVVGLRKLNEEGKSPLVRLHGPGKTLGYRSFLTQSKHLLTAEVLKPAHVCFIPSKSAHDLLTSNPLLGLHLLQQKIEDLSEADERFTHTVTNSVRLRLLHVLLVLSERFGHRDRSNEYVIDLPLSRKDLASLIGVEPESLSRIVRQLQAAGIANFNGRRVHIHDVNAVFDELEQVA